MKILKSLVIALAVCPTALQAAETPADEKLPPGTKLIRIEARPAAVTLKHPYDYTQLLLTGHLDNGDRVDVTRSAQIVKPANLVNISPRGLVRPAADGSGELKITAYGQAVAVPVKVSGQKEPYQVSFVRDVMPTMSKMGCNAGTCHGAQAGKNGFKLSLRGYDPLLDHRALTDDHGGRRFNRAAPDRSLMLLKPSGVVAHVGGALTQPGEPYYELLRTWIAEGVKLDLNAARVTGLDIHPKGPVVPLPGMKQQMAVLATYADGSTRDVTAETFIESSNTDVATVDKQGLVAAARRGETTMLARYEGAYTATTLVVMGDRGGFAWKDVPESNFIDGLVYEKLKQVKIQPSDVCTDSEFIRRLYLDLTGLPPQPQDVRAFLADTRPVKVKRDEMVDKLVGSPEYIEHWTNKWADLLQVNRKFLGDQGALALRNWIRQAVTTNMPYDKFAYAILSASGSTLDNPPAAYYKVLREPQAAVENTTQLFLAVRFNCNKCHDHPFERWTQDQYYQLGAFFAQVDRKPDPRFAKQTIGGTAVEGALPLVEIIADLGSGDIKHDRTGLITPPAFPFKHNGAIPANVSRREQLARWIATKENPYFAKSYVNRLWSYLLGVGIIEPVDDIRAGNPPSNPKLLDRLSSEFVDSGFNVQQVFRTICKSRTYQLSIVTNQWNKDDELNYSHALARRLPAEVLFDAIHRSTGSLSKLPGMAPGMRAAQLLDSNVEIPSGFLDLFGKPPRESACECERSGSMMLGPVLNLVNGPIVGEALKDPDNRIAKIVAAEKNDARIIEELYLTLLCRLPAKQEVETGLKALKESEGDYNKLVEEFAPVAAALAQFEKLLPDRQAEWEKNYAKVTAWKVLDAAGITSKGGATLTKQPDGSILATGKNVTPETYTFTANTPLTGITGIRLELLPDPSLVKMGPGRAPNGNLVLTEFRATAGPIGNAAQARQVGFLKAVADYAQPQYPAAGAIDGDPQSGWAIDPAYGKRHVAVFETKEPIVGANGVALTIMLDQQFAATQHNIGRFRISVTTAPPPLLLEGPPDAIAKVLATPRDKRTDQQKAELANYYRSLDPEWARLNQVLALQPKPPSDKRLIGAQDIAWALLNSPEFLFNH